MRERGRRWRGTIPAVLAASVALLSAPTAASAAVQAAKPTAGTVHLSKATVTHPGGEITIAATARHASRCTVASSPSLHGLSTAG